MTKEHIIGELYIKNLELYKAHQSLLVENKNLQQEYNILKGILTSKAPEPKNNIEDNEVALAEPKKDLEKLDGNL